MIFMVAVVATVIPAPELSAPRFSLSRQVLLGALSALFGSLL
jgi:hypothetical protein